MARLSKTTALLLTMAATIGISGSAHATVTFKSVQINTTSSTNAVIGAVTTTQSKTTSASAKNLVPVIPLKTSNSATTTGKVGSKTGVVASASGTATASFTGAAAGTFDAVSNNSIVQSIASTRATPIHSTSAASAYTFTYKFDNVGRSRLLLDYLLFDPAAVASSRVVASLSGGSGSFVQTLLPNSSGSISANLFSGSYSLILRSTAMDKIVRPYDGIGTTLGQSNDHFSFSVAAVPEASTWAMMILGFGMIGFTLRRRTGNRAFAAA